MLNTRLLVIRKKPTWMITESVSTTNSPPRMISSSSVRVTIAMPASAPPSASEPVSPMKILAGLAFHHRKPKQAPIAAAATRATSRGSRTCVAAGRPGGEHAGLPELPERDDHVGGEHHHRGAAGEAVEAVGEVDRVGRRRDDQVGEDRRTRPRRGRRRGRGRRRSSSRGRREPGRRCSNRSASDGEADRDEQLAGELGLALEPEAALLDDLDVVVEEADHAQAAHQVQHEQARRRSGRGPGGRSRPGARPRSPISVAAMMTIPPMVGVPRLVAWRARAVLADLLAVATAAEHPDGDRGADDRDHQRGQRGDEDGPHGPTSGGPGVGVGSDAGGAGSGARGRAAAALPGVPAPPSGRP